MSNFVQQIKNTEEKAREEVKRAQELAAQIQEKARHTALEENEKVKVEAMKKAQERLNLTKEETKKVCAHTLASFSGDLQRISDAERKVPQTVDALFKSILEKISA